MCITYIECCRYWIAIKMCIITESITPVDLLSCTLNSQMTQLHSIGENIIIECSIQC